MKKYILFLLLLTFVWQKLPGAPPEDLPSPIVAFEYWFDGNFGARTVVPVTPGEQQFTLTMADASACAEGIHRLYFRARDEEGRWSVVQSQAFIRLVAENVQEMSPISYYEYWFDNDFAARKTFTPTSGMALTLNTVDASACTEGVHTLRYRARDEKGWWSTVYSQAFIRRVSSEGEELSPISYYEYWFDNDFDARKKITPSSTDGVLSLKKIDASACSEGVHNLRYRARDENGQWTPVYSQAFIRRVTSVEELSPISYYEYWFDNNFDARKKITVDNPGELLSMSMADASACTEGVHRLRYRVRDENGQWSVVYTQAFYRQPSEPVDANLITAYRYWVDDMPSTLVTLQTPVSPFELDGIIKLAEDLDENTGHLFSIQFCDSYNNWSIVMSKTFTISTTIEPVTEIEINLDLTVSYVAGTSITLTATIEPDDASKQTIVWSVVNAGTTGATITGGNKLNTTGAGEVVIKATITDGLGTGKDYTKEFTVKIKEFIKAVAELKINLPALIEAGKTITLTASIEPADASKQTIVWSVVNAGSTGATITGSNNLNTTGAGEVVIKATIIDGLDVGVDFSKEFTIKIEAAFIAVTGITGVPTAATAKTPLTLTGTVAPTNATNKTIVWSVKTAGTTGATISGNTLNTTAEGTVVITATVVNGKTANTDYTQDFNITVNAVTGNSEIFAPNLKIYPNPFTDLVRITGADAVETRHATSLRITNAAGMVVHTQTITGDDEIIRLEHLPDGVYFFTIESGNQSKTMKVVKN